jgi:hypothetical protein
MTSITQFSVVRVRMDQGADILLASRTATKGDPTQHINRIGKTKERLWCPARMTTVSDATAAISVSTVAVVRNTLRGDLFVTLFI